MLGIFNSHKLEDYKNNKPELNIEDFFNGEIKGWGIIQNWRGRVTSQFEIYMSGSWHGEHGTLKERMVFYNGEEQNRTWDITKNLKGKFIATANDIIGEAIGLELGNTMFWSYYMKIKSGRSRYLLHINDWSWLMKDDVMINNSYFKKFGITVAELTLFMQKQKS